MDDLDKGKTELLEILKRCRTGGLNLTTADYLAVFYDQRGLNMIFRFEDGRTYSMALKELREAPSDSDDKEGYT